MKSHINTKNKAALKLSDAIYSYLFEQECGELRYESPANIDAIRHAGNILRVIALNGQPIKSK